MASDNLKAALLHHLNELAAMTGAERLEKRYQKFRAFGHVMDKQKAAVTAAAA